MDHPNLSGAWDAFKAFLRGIFVAEVNTIKKNTNAQRDQAAQLVRKLEAEYIADSTEVTMEAWMAAQDAVNRIDMCTADRKLFFNKLAFYEEGEQTGRLLAKIVKSNQTSPSIGALRTREGKMVNTLTTIMLELVRFYSNLYCSKQAYSQGEL